MVHFPLAPHKGDSWGRGRAEGISARLQMWGVKIPPVVCFPLHAQQTSAQGCAGGGGEGDSYPLTLSEAEACEGAGLR